ncbi:SpaN/EivJ family type III secretion system needle length determinant [Paludibacterium paludis]|uniref:Surface presentation of antigen domain-containing protein n=1 Tax=Paludibacterium paludis TaxID=1225769 RepID=A0A918P609_9NEIS|nr:hypothetical protein [Paludibacterium paludis]GGY23986.1 hypothetical protein GCM10011289_29640 [Paludibacterium paludis]
MEPITPMPATRTPAQGEEARSLTSRMEEMLGKQGAARSRGTPAPQGRDARGKSGPAKAHTEKKTVRHEEALNLEGLVLAHPAPLPAHAGSALVSRGYAKAGAARPAPERAPGAGRALPVDRGVASAASHEAPHASPRGSVPPRAGIVAGPLRDVSSGNRAPQVPGTDGRLTDRSRARDDSRHRAGDIEGAASVNGFLPTHAMRAAAPAPADNTRPAAPPMTRPFVAPVVPPRPVQPDGSLTYTFKSWEGNRFVTVRDIRGDADAARWRLEPSDAMVGQRLASQMPHTVAGEWQLGDGNSGGHARHDQDQHSAGQHDSHDEEEA